MTRTQKWAYFAAIVAVALSLGPSLAHLFALPNKIGLDQERYFVVQGIYRGWDLLGVVVVAALLSTFVLTVLLRGRRVPMRWAALAFACVVGAQVLFWTYTFPANQATANWTVVPQDWEALRARWEYSHAGGAALNLMAMIALVLSALWWGTSGRGDG